MRPLGPTPLAAVAGSLLAMALLTGVPVLAEPPSPPAQGATRFEIRFVPREERAAVAYELVAGIPLFKAAVEGTEVWAMIDNRATRTLVDVAFARSLGLVLTPTGGTTTVTGSLESWQVAGADLAIPGQIRMRTPIVATDLSFISNVAGRPISLVLGKEYFDVLAVVVTPRDRHIQFAPSGTLRLPEDTPYLVLRNDRPQVDAMVGGKPAVLTVDLGYTGEVSVTRAAADRLGIDLARSELGLLAGGEGRPVTSSSTVVEAVAFGATSLEGVRIDAGYPRSEDGDGLLGFGLLARSNFALDLKARRLWLIPPRPAAPPASEGGRSAQ